MKIPNKLFYFGVYSAHKFIEYSTAKDLRKKIEVFLRYFYCLLFAGMLWDRHEFTMTKFPKETLSSFQQWWPLCCLGSPYMLRPIEGWLFYNEALCNKVPSLWPPTCSTDRLLAIYCYVSVSGLLLLLFCSVANSHLISTLSLFCVSLFP